MYPGYWSVFIGIFAIICGIMLKNSMNKDDIFIKKHRKTILKLSGIGLIILGTIEFIYKST